ncbi:MAG: rod shape-determining protein MreD [Lysobacterales bacterium]
MSRRRDSAGLVTISFLVAMALTVIPMPDGLTWLRPYWVGLTVIYWTIESPSMMNLGRAFAIGLVLDLLTGTMAGLHALSLVVIVYIVQRFRLRMRFFPLWQQALAVGAILLNDRVIYAWIQSLSGAGISGPEFLWAPPVAILVWPWMFLLLDRLRQRYRAR